MAVKKKTAKQSTGKAAKKTVKKTVKKGTKAARGRASGKISIANEFKKISTAVIVLVGVVAVLAMVADLYMGRPVAKREAAPVARTTPDRPEPEPVQSKKRVSIKPEPSRKPDKKATTSRKHPVFEVFDDSDETPKQRPEPAAVPPVLQDKTPRVAIIIDDIGFDKKISLAISGLDPHITLSILPYAPHAKAIALLLHQRGTETLLHLPMEPMEYPKIDPGPGALLSTMTPDELLDQLRLDLDIIPFVAGVNNHMGSRMTSLSPQMNQIFTVLKQRNLFFIDSLTAKGSLCRQSARLLRIPFAQRDVFLDNVQDADYIKKQLAQLLAVAQRHGTAIGIGHPYRATYLTLKSEMERLKKKIRIVPASALVAIPG
ncbi:divergent polysaccharide deacetylase family protein [Desulforapulum autotrophicum]|uniref:divergent polysaccharide deacetylase family protein n=1 Tax=Desulforapulum autotrophicum TaxID=2296 RepID=UPI0002EE46D4|nr:divergent polysaccharide deacetylase family protein [Desulforapulum autotrophicum]